MIGLNEKLRMAERPIRVALVGAGYVAGGLFNVIRHVPNMNVVAVYDPDVPLAERLGVRVLRSPQELSDVEYDVLADADCRAGVGAACACQAIENGRHVVSINIECDMTVGPCLARLAAAHNCVYTVTAGDEPGDLKALYDHYALLGFRIVALGKGKNNPLQVTATPETVRPSVPANGITAEQVCGFVDGSKTMFEMGCLANAIGFAPDIAGMHGPEATLRQLPEIFRAQSQGGILSREGVVDFVTGPELSGGLFIVVHTDDPRICSDFSYLKIGKGPYFAFYQRFHNWFIDMPLSVARAALLREPTLVPLPRATCMVAAVAKRDLSSGEKLDGIGGYCCYGQLRSAAEAEGLLPHGLTECARMKTRVAAGSLLRTADVTLDDRLDLVRLWRQTPVV